MANLFSEMKQYVRFDESDEAALSELLPALQPHFRGVTELFYERVREHPEAHRVFSGPAQAERLKQTLCDWMDRLLRGPWDDDYFLVRSRIGRVHVRIGLPQRYMFGAMDLIRTWMTDEAGRLHPEAVARGRAVRALQKIFDLELSIMLETYHQAHLEALQDLERRQRDLLEARLAMSEARSREIVDKAEVLIASFEGNGRLLLCNPRCRRFAGDPGTEVLGQSFYELFVAPEQRREVEALGTRVLAGETGASHEGSCPRADGAARVRWHFTTVPSAEGRMLCAIGIDVTGEHAMALRTRRAERLASLGTMAAGLAHEIRNPLNAAHLQLALVQRRLSRAGGADVGGAQEAAGVVAGEIQRLAHLVKEFLDFARPQALRLAEHDLSACAQTVVDLLAPEAAQVGVGVSLSPGPVVRVQMDEERIRQVLINLVRNAIEAVAGSQEGSVRLQVAERADAAVLTVIDSGPGIAAEAPVFEPFFTTKVDGTGLGLAIVHRVIDDHGGQISFRSQPGQTVFEMQLPKT